MRQSDLHNPCLPLQRKVLAYFFVGGELFFGDGWRKLSDRVTDVRRASHVKSKRQTKEKKAIWRKQNAHREEIKHDK